MHNYEFTDRKPLKKVGLRQLDTMNWLHTVHKMTTEKTLETIQAEERQLINELVSAPYPSVEWIAKAGELDRFRGRVYTSRDGDVNWELLRRTR